MEVVHLSYERVRASVDDTATQRALGFTRWHRWEGAAVRTSAGLLTWLTRAGAPLAAARPARAPPRSAPRWALALRSRHDSGATVWVCSSVLTLLDAMGTRTPCGGCQHKGLILFRLKMGPNLIGSYSRRASGEVANREAPKRLYSAAPDLLLPLERARARRIDRLYIVGGIRDAEAVWPDHGQAVLQALRGGVSSPESSDTESLDSEAGCGTVEMRGDARAEGEVSSGTWTAGVGNRRGTLSPGNGSSQTGSTPARLSSLGDVSLGPCTPEGGVAPGANASQDRFKVDEYSPLSRSTPGKNTPRLGPTPESSTPTSNATSSALLSTLHTKAGNSNVPVTTCKVIRMDEGGRVHGVPCPIGSWSLQLPATSRTVVGLANLGNTCYLNSALQALLSVEAFREWAASHANSRGGARARASALASVAMGSATSTPRVDPAPWPGAPAPPRHRLARRVLGFVFRSTMYKPDQSPQSRTLASTAASPGSRSWVSPGAPSRGGSHPAAPLDSPLLLTEKGTPTTSPHASLHNTQVSKSDSHLWVGADEVAVPNEDSRWDELVLSLGLLVQDRARGRALSCPTLARAAADLWFGGLGEPQDPAEFVARLLGAAAHAAPAVRLTRVRPALLSVAGVVARDLPGAHWHARARCFLLRPGPRTARLAEACARVARRAARARGPLGALFGGVLAEQARCLRCVYSNTHFSAFDTLNIAIPHAADANTGHAVVLAISLGARRYEYNALLDNATMTEIRSAVCTLLNGVASGRAHLEDTKFVCEWLARGRGRPTSVQELYAEDDPPFTAGMIDVWANTCIGTSAPPIRDNTRLATALQEGLCIGVRPPATAKARPIVWVDTGGRTLAVTYAVTTADIYDASTLLFGPKVRVPNDIDARFNGGSGRPLCLETTKYALQKRCIKTLGGALSEIAHRRAGWPAARWAQPTAAVDVATCIKAVSKPEQVVSWKCPHCRARGCERRARVAAWPAHLLLGVARFTARDLHAPLRAGPTLAPAKGVRYALRAAVCHTGDAQSGHFYTVCHNGLGWFYADDTVVPTSHLPSVPNAYMLLYEKV